MNNSLQQTALDVIAALGMIPHWSDFNIAVIGGLARLHYNPVGRRTADVDFMVECPVEDSLAVSKAIHEDLVAHFRPDFYEDPSGFCYRQTAPNGGEPASHRISFYGPIIAPYLPPGLQQVHNIPQGVIPYIPLADLIVFKLHSCGLRSTPEETVWDILDAKEMLNLLMQPLVLTAVQQDALMGRLSDATTHDPDRTPVQWWRRWLGLPADFN